MFKKLVVGALATGIALTGGMGALQLIHKSCELSEASDLLHSL